MRGEARAGAREVGKLSVRRPSRELCQRQFQSDVVSYHSAPERTQTGGSVQSRSSRRSTLARFFDRCRRKLSAFKVLREPVLRRVRSTSDDSGGRPRVFRAAASGEDSHAPDRCRVRLEHAALTSPPSFLLHFGERGGVRAKEASHRPPPQPRQIQPIRIPATPRCQDSCRMAGVTSASGSTPGGEGG